MPWMGLEVPRFLRIMAILSASFGGGLPISLDDLPPGTFSSALLAYPCQFGKSHPLTAHCPWPYPSGLLTYFSSLSSLFGVPGSAHHLISPSEAALLSVSHNHSEQLKRDL